MVSASLCGWWYCCFCNNIVNPTLSDRVCPACGHAQCSSCRSLCTEHAHDEFGIPTTQGLAAPAMSSTRSDATIYSVSEWPSPWRDVLSTGSSTRSISSVSRHGVKDVDPVEDPFEVRLTHLVKRFSEWNSDIWGPYHNYGWLRAVAELRYIPPETIRVDRPPDGGSLINTCQGVVEALTRTKWDWWPFPQHRRPLAPDESRLSWTCECGEDRWTDVPTFFANELQNFLQGYLPSDEGACQDGDASARGPASHGRKHGHRVVLSQIPGLRSRSKGQPTNRGIQSTSPTSASQSGSSSPSTQVQHAGSGSACQAPPERYVLLLVERGRRNILSQIHVHQLDDNTFFQCLRSEYFRLRGWLRNWMSVWRYSHCDFYQMEKFEDSQYATKVKDDYPTLKDNYDYVAQPLNPPISPHEFHCRFYSCYRPNRWSLHLFHVCKKAIGVSRDALNMIPKKKERLEEHGDKRQRFWGIYAREIVCFRWIVAYNLACMTPMVIFFFLWTFRVGDGQLQNAAVPLSILLAGLSLFWSLFLGSLSFGRGGN